MTTQGDFLSDTMGTLEVRYPYAAGFKRDGTSKEAAPTKSEAETLREEVLRVLKVWPLGLTADEIAHKANKSILSIRPRVSELSRLGKITETNERRRNSSGKWAAVWRAI